MKKQGSDVAGKKIHMLSVLGYAYSKNNKVYMNCKCDCGNDCVVSAILIRNGHTKSCGCLYKESIVNFNKRSKTNDITGKKFGRLTALNLVENEKNDGAYWLFECDCGNKVVRKGSEVKRGKTSSCGCLAKERQQQNFKTHGFFGTRIYAIWVAMKNRCNNPNVEAYPNYGGRGITYDTKWETFEGFYEDMKDGYENHLTLERIDVDDNYYKENCTWITKSEQSQNKRNTVYIAINKETKTIRQWSNVSGIPYATIHRRYKAGWDESDLLKPVKNKSKKTSKKHILALVSFSGGGKDTIARKLESDHNYKFVVSTTSRPIRSSELNGREYYFVTDEEFQELIINNKLIEYRNYNTYQNGKSAIWHYGITRDSIDLSKGNHVAIVDIKGLKDLKKEFGDKVISIFIDVDEETRRNRAIQRDRNFELVEWQRRWEDDRKIFKNIHNEVDHIVENYNFDKCMEQIIKILNKEV